MKQLVQAVGLIASLLAPGFGAQVTNIIMKTTGECLAAETIEAGAKMHTAFVFIKPHAVPRA